MRELSATRRRFFMHPAHRTIGISAGIAAWQVCRELGRPAADPRPRPMRVGLLLPGSRRLQSRLSPLLAERLRQWTADDAAFSFCVEHLRPATLELDHCDCLVLLPGAIELEDWQVRCIRRYGRRGGAMVVFGAADLAFPGWPELAREITGGRCRPPRAAEPCRVMPVAAARHHPILSGVEPFCCRMGLAAVAELSADASVLLTASGGVRTEPVAWIRQDVGRVFSTTLGDGDECLQTGFIRLLVNAVAWTCEDQQTG